MIAAPPPPVVVAAGPPLNPYVAYHPGWTGDTDLYEIEDELCGIAQMDAWHDHHSITGLGTPNIELLVQGYTTSPCGKPPGDEDAYMVSRLINPQYAAYCKVQTTATLEAAITGGTLKHPQIGGNNIFRLYEFVDDGQPFFRPVVSSRYKVMYCDTQNLPGDIRFTDYSLIQAALRSQGIEEDFFLIKDTAKSDYAADLLKVGTGQFNQSTQCAISLLTGPGIYDPGPTTTPYTGTGIDMGFKTPNIKSQFGIIDFSDPNESIVSYPEWTGGHTKYEPVERLIYSKYDCKMVSSTQGALANVEKYIKDTNSVLYIKETKLDGTTSIFYVDKTTSDKATDLSQLDFKEKLQKIGLHRFPPGFVPFPEASQVATISGPKKIFSKKVGDGGQALYTLRERISYRRFIPDANGVHTLAPPVLSNGIHGFVSFDRVAIVSSLFYGAPISIYITDNGFVVYISKRLIEKFSTPEAKIKKRFDEVKNKKEKIMSLHPEWEDGGNKIIELNKTISECRTILINLHKFIGVTNTQFIGKITQITSQGGRAGTTAKQYDMAYKFWLSKLYLYNRLSSALGNYYGKYTGNSDRAGFVTLKAELSTAYGTSTTIMGKFNLQPGMTDVTQGEAISPLTQTDTRSDIYYLLQHNIDNGGQPPISVDALINMLDTDITSLTQNINIYNQFEAWLEELNLIIDDIYMNVDDIDYINTLQPSEMADEKELNRRLKSYNPQIADSISNITFAQGLQSPNCVMKLFSCFGTSKLPYIGPIYDVCRYYQKLPDIPATSATPGVDIITSIIGSYHVFLSKVKDISKEALFLTQMDYLNNRLSEINELEIKQLTETTIAKLGTCYNSFLPTNGGNGGGRTCKYKGKNKKHTIRKRKIIKGGFTKDQITRLSEKFYNYEQYNSTISLSFIYFALLFPPKEPADSIFELWGSVLDETMVGKIRLIHTTLTSIQGTIQPDKYFSDYRNISKILHERIEEARKAYHAEDESNLTGNIETSDFKMIISNIVGKHNFILFKIIIILLELTEHAMTLSQWAYTQFTDGISRWYNQTTEFTSDYDPTSVAKERAIFLTSELILALNELDTTPFVSLASQLTIYNDTLGSLIHNGTIDPGNDDHYLQLEKQMTIEILHKSPLTEFEDINRVLIHIMNALTHSVEGQDQAGNLVMIDPVVAYEQRLMEGYKEPPKAHVSKVIVPDSGNGPDDVLSGIGLPPPPYSIDKFSTSKGPKRIKSNIALGLQYVKGISRPRTRKDDEEKVKKYLVERGIFTPKSTKMIGRTSSAFSNVSADSYRAADSSEDESYGSDSGNDSPIDSQIQRVFTYDDINERPVPFDILSGEDSPDFLSLRRKSVVSREGYNVNKIQAEKRRGVSDKGGKYTKKNVKKRRVHKTIRKINKKRKTQKKRS